METGKAPRVGGLSEPVVDKQETDDQTEEDESDDDQDALENRAVGPHHHDHAEADAEQHGQKGCDDQATTFGELSRVGVLPDAEIFVDKGCRQQDKSEACSVVVGEVCLADNDASKDTEDDGRKLGHGVSPFEKCMQYGSGLNECQ